MIRRMQCLQTRAVKVAKGIVLWPVIGDLSSDLIVRGSSLETTDLVSFDASTAGPVNMLPYSGQ